MCALQTCAGHTQKVSGVRYGSGMAHRKCKIDGCEKFRQNAGMCRAHWREVNGIPVNQKSVAKHEGPCKGPECERPARKLGYCRTHYQQWSNRGRVWVIGSLVGRQTYTECLAFGCGAETTVWGYCERHAREHLGACVILWCEETVRLKRLGLCDQHARQNRYMKHHYGIGILERYGLAERQGYRCAACGVPDERGSLHVDHCHETGKVRGLLCGNCNRAIGLFQDNPAALRAAAEYLEKYG